MKKLFFSPLLLSLIFVFTNCDGDEDTAQDKSNLNISFQKLENLGANYVYEGWLITPQGAVSAGRFSVNNSGQLSKTAFSISKDVLSSATSYVLTIEPASGDDPGPSKVHVIAGDFSGSSATLNVSHSAALQNSFSSASGKYILATPTDNVSTNEDSGVWFLDNSSGSPMKGLTLPTLPEGWKYEGWAVVNGVPLSTGTFTSVTMMDMAKMFSGPNMEPPFPGEDFLINPPSGLTFPTSLKGGKIVISIEPNPDNSPAPFAFKPLEHSVPVNAMTHSVLNMNLNLASFPTGSVSR